MIRAYVTPSDDRAIRRVVYALRYYAPVDVVIKDDYADARTIILHVFGRRDAIERKVEKILNDKKQYAVIQYCVRSTIYPHTSDWIDIWNNAKAVWSYYDLYGLCQEDNIEHNFNFYHAPLGVDPVFRKSYDGQKIFKIMSHGRAWTTESIREIGWAAKNTNNLVLHLGSINRRNWIKSITGISDCSLAHMYGLCDYVAGLRRTEGFELPVIEGLVCGARPIVFDRPHYRKWFNKWAIFIEENSREDVIKSLEDVFLAECKPVSENEIFEAIKFFDWHKIIHGFWRSLR